MKIAAISDTHGNNVSGMVPECDVLCICGDISPSDAPHTINEQRAWYRNEFIRHLLAYRNKAKRVVFVAGNHDRFLYNCHLNGQNDAEIRAMLPDGVHYLDGESIAIDGVKFHGTPWVNLPIWAEAGGAVWNFASKSHEFLAAAYAAIPDDVDVVLSHGPAYGYCDQILDSGVVDLALVKFGDSLKAEHLGCLPLTARMKELAIGGPAKIRSVLSGHIHSANHQVESWSPLERSESRVDFCCASVLDEGYALGCYEPLGLELNN